MDEITTQIKGLETELKCQLDFTSRGYRVLLPLDDGCVYDVAVDIGCKIIRVQCKTARWVKDTKETNVCFEISLTRQTTNTKRTAKHKYTKEEIDYFYTYFNGKSYLVPVKDNLPSVMRFRYNVPKYGSAINTNIEKDYSFDNYFPMIIDRKDGESRNEKRCGGCCRKCGAPTYKNAMLCITCRKRESSAKTQELRDMPIGELAKKIRNTSFAEIGREYGVTGNAIRKICKSRGLPSKVSEIKDMTDLDWHKLLCKYYPQGKAK